MSGFDSADTESSGYNSNSTSTSTSDSRGSSPERAERSQPSSSASGDKSKRRGLGGLLGHRWDGERSNKAGISKPKLKLKYKGNSKAPSDEFVIRVELDMDEEEAHTDAAATAPGEEGARRPRRASRMWVREKKGKRWVENDYMEVMALLRKL